MHIMYTKCCECPERKDYFYGRQWQRSRAIQLKLNTGAQELAAGGRWCPFMQCHKFVQCFAQGVYSVCWQYPTPLEILALFKAVLRVGSNLTERLHLWSFSRTAAIFLFFRIPLPISDKNKKRKTIQNNLASFLSHKINIRDFGDSY